MINGKNIAAEKMNVVFITLDTLRYDAAERSMQEGELATFSRYFSSWQKRHSPGSFTFASHQAFFAGFLPTPVNEPQQQRLFALAFEGSNSIGDQTLIFDQSNIIDGFKELGYNTLCIGGVGFFNKKTPLGEVIPNMFCESFWCKEFGVTDKHSTDNQVKFAIQHLTAKPKNPFFLFINISAIHQPNYFYSDSSQTNDDVNSHQKALEYVDKQLASLFDWLPNQGKSAVILCSDHGTTYGEDNCYGHRLAHQNIWDVPYAEFIIEAAVTNGNS